MKNMRNLQHWLIAVKMQVYSQNQGFIGALRGQYKMG
jgi:hypothetical protein